MSTLDLSTETVPGAKVSRVPLGRQIANVVRSDILYGRLRSGTRVGQQELCERYGTSRMPVRDALRQLTYEGFLHEDGTGHSIVTALTRSDLQDIYLIEGMLHALALRRVVERNDPDEIAELLGYHRDMQDAEHHTHTDRMAELNWQFHRRINHLARSPKLLAVIRTHTLSIPNDQVRQFPQWAQRVNQEHAEIMDAVAHGRAATAERLMKRHVIAAGDDLITHLESLGMELA
ncbi:GntR family transcriptional regulator [Pseudonocardia sulfidoxydans]|uniref:GntR family transcriptional regulator n=1 Tax=Pseudonocardia sulfidoxydans TaxID=54011 RepID=UPI0035E6C541